MEELLSDISFKVIDLVMNVGCWGMAIMFVVLGIDSLLKPPK